MKPTVETNPTVFICAKKEDSKYAKQIYSFLKSKGIAVFYSEVSLPSLGNTDYRTEIDIALDQVIHMIIVTSKIEYLKSTWVEAEWGFFINEKRSGRKRGNIITVCVGDLKILLPSLPPSLRYYEVIPYEPDNFENIMNYIDKSVNPDYIEPKPNPVILPELDSTSKHKVIRLSLTIISIAALCFIFYFASGVGGKAEEWQMPKVLILSFVFASILVVTNYFIVKPKTAEELKKLKKETYYYFTFSVFSGVIGLSIGYFFWYISAPILAERIYNGNYYIGSLYGSYIGAFLLAVIYIFLIRIIKREKNNAFFWIIYIVFVYFIIWIIGRCSINNFYDIILNIKSEEELGISSNRYGWGLAGAIGSLIMYPFYNIMKFLTKAKTGGNYEDK